MTANGQHHVKLALKLVYLEAGVESRHAVVRLDGASREVEQVQPGEGIGAGEGHVRLRTCVRKATIGVCDARRCEAQTFCFFETIFVTFLSFSGKYLGICVLHEADVPSFCDSFQRRSACFGWNILRSSGQIKYLRQVDILRSNAERHSALRQSHPWYRSEQLHSLSRWRTNIVKDKKNIFGRQVVCVRCCSR